MTAAEVEDLARHLDDETEWETAYEFWSVWGPRGSTRLQRLIMTARSGTMPDVGTGAHAPRWSTTTPPIVSCACGWSCPSDVQDSDNAFVMHVALAQLGLSRAWATEAPAVSQPDLDAAAQAHVDHLLSATPAGPRFDDLCKTFFAGARWYRDVEKSQANEAGKLCRAVIHALEVQRALHAELAQTAIAWAIADRLADDRSADLEVLQDEIATLPELDVHRLRGKLEQARVAFHRADQHAMQCDEILRQAARQLADMLEPSPTPAGDPT